MFANLNGTIPPILLESLIALSGSKHNYCKEIASKFSTLLTGQDKDAILVEWRKNLPILTEENTVASTFPVESHTLTVIDAHISEICKHSNYSILLSVKHTAKSICNLILKLLNAYKMDATVEQRIQSLMIPMLFDVRTEYLYDVSKQCLQVMLGDSTTSDTFKLLAQTNILRFSYRLLVDYAELAAQGTAVNLDESVLHSILQYWETMLNDPMGMKAMKNFFYVNKIGSLVQVLISFTGTSLTQSYATKILQFFENLFKSAEKSDSNFKLDELCTCISDLGQVDNANLKSWLSHILMGPIGTNASQSSNVPTPTNMATTSQIPSIFDQIFSPDPDAMEIDYECTARIGPIDDQTIDSQANDKCTDRNGLLLQTLTKYIVTENKITANVCSALFQALIQLGQNLLCPAQDSIDFADLLQVMITLADTALGKGHSQLFAASVDWLEVSKSIVLEKISTNNDLTQSRQTRAAVAFENITSILKYMVELLQGLGHEGSQSLVTTWEDETPAEFDDYLDDVVGEEDDSAVEDSDEDSLGSKLCTYWISKKEFINQHWYHCHTCKLIDKAGVCSVCARVCHKNHEVSYAKYGNFFCDCGAKEDSSCQAMSKRTNNQQDQPSTSGINTQNINDTETSTSRRRTTTPPPTTSRDYQIIDRTTQLSKVIEASKDNLKTSDKWRIVIKCLLEFFENLMPAIQENCAKYSTVGCQLRAKNALERLHQPVKSFSVSDQLMTATLDSQEGAFENVRMNFSGEQGQTIRQLLSTNLVRRVALCCLSSPHGKRQHLAVSHEKGKVMILQLSALLKQADASKRKLTLSRLSSAPIPCIVLSLSSNPANEDFLAVCGLKECHILTFSGAGAVNDHIVLTPQLETGNFIKRAIWLPGSQTKLALVTADFVKIYELAEDTFSPQYYFVVPSGKIRDCTFIHQDDGYYMLIFASSGYIYTQPLADESLAKHGAFYVTNTLELDHPLIKDSNGLVGGGGVSIYYSHVLQLLFFSYSQGKSFMAPLIDVNKGVKCVIQLQTGPPNAKNSTKAPLQPLCQWTEIPGHPGLICAMMQTSNNPVIFMLKPDGIAMQEIKAQNSKAKIMDMVAIRHASSGIEKTTLLLLCEDGSLRIYAANAENTNYWLSPEVQPIANPSYSSAILRSGKKGKKGVNSKPQLGNGKIGNSSLITSSAVPPTFPIDFFEHCNCLTDIEFGGNDLLQIYNTQQLKHRLNASGLYVTSTRVNGFTLEITNNDPNTVITGIRVLIGTQDQMRAPQSVTILNRTINTATQRARWFDIPLTREESLQSDKKLKVVFGPSSDAENVNMLDSIKVYGKTKDVFSWPEESDDNGTSVNNANSLNNLLMNTANNAGVCDGNALTITPLDRMMTSMLEVLDGGISLLGGSTIDDELKQKAIDVSTKILLHPLPNVVQMQTKSVLATLFGNKNTYNTYKDKEIISEVDQELKKLKNIRDVRNIDPEAFYRLVMMIRNIAVSRPQSLAQISKDNQYEIVPSFMTLLYALHEITPSFEEQTSIVRIGLSHPEAIVHALIEIIYSFALSDIGLVQEMTLYFVNLLLNKAKIISYSTKQAMIKLLRFRVRRRKAVQNATPVCTTPTPTTSQPLPNVTAENVAISTSSVAASSSSNVANQRNNAGEDAAPDDFVNLHGLQEVDVVEPLGLEVANNQQALASVEALVNMGMLRGFPQLLDMNADEESIMEFALALSLQEQELDMEAIQQGFANFQAANNRAGQSAAAGGGLEPAASIGSDDEASNAATDGSTLRTSPAEPTGSGGSESGGSGVESIGETSGRSSTYGDQIHSSPPRNTEIAPIQPEPTTSSAVIHTEESREIEQEDSVESETIQRLHVLR